MATKIVCDIVKAEADTLIGLLAQGDAAFVPARDCRSPRWVNATHAREVFRLHGVPMPYAGSAAERQAHGRRLETLASAGVVVLSRPKGTRTPHVRLTDSADWALREAAGLPGRVGCLLALQEVARRTRGRVRIIRHRWCPENLLGNVRDTHELRAVEDMLLPALCRGWAVSLTNTVRLVHYAVTPSGREALADAAEELKAAAPPADGDRELWEAYQVALNRALAALEVDTGRGRDIACVPLPASIAATEPIGPWVV